jgi:hypothetical protein
MSYAEAHYLGDVPAGGPSTCSCMTTTRGRCRGIRPAGAPQRRREANGPNHRPRAAPPVHRTRSVRSRARHGSAMRRRRRSRSARPPRTRPRRQSCNRRAGAHQHPTGGDHLEAVRASTCRQAALGGSSSNAACTVPVDQPAPASATNWCAAGPSAQRRTGLGRTAATSTQTFQATGGAPPATSLLEDTETQVSDLSGLSQRRLPESDRLAVRCPEEPVRRSLPFDGRRCRPFRRRGPPRSNPPPGRLTWNIGRAVPRRRPEPGPPRGRPTPYGRRCGGRRHRRSVRYGRRRLRRSR